MVETLYTDFVFEIRKQIMARGLTMAECDALSRNPHGYTAKMLHPETPSGRRATWESLEKIVKAAFPDGFRIKIKSTDGATTAAPTRGARSIALGKVTMRDFAAFAGRRSGATRCETIPPAKRSAIASRAARARWKDKKQPKWKRRILARKAKRARERRARKGEAT